MMNGMGNWTWLRRFWYGVPLAMGMIIIGIGLFRPVSAPPRPPHQTEGKTHASRAATEQTLPALPDGSRSLVPHHRMVALYGTPSMPVLGALGEQPMAETMARVKAVAAQYQALSTEPVLPTLEIIATVASASPTENGDYSQEIPVEQLAPWVQAARDQGVYVILDLQPGRTDFLTQAKQYESLLRQPHVGLALDPEWRLEPGQVHLEQIGWVGSGEVNAVTQWLAALTHDAQLPQKAFLLHQFRTAMLPDRDAINTSHAELAYLIQMDGQGGQAVKQDTWRTLLAQPPAHMYFGWKNFFDEDKPMLTPAETMAVQPAPWYISYQ